MAIAMTAGRAEDSDSTGSGGTPPPTMTSCRLTPNSVDLITPLMASHAQGGVVESAVMCEWLLRRVVVEVDVNVHGGFCYRRRGGQ